MNEKLQYAEMLEIPVSTCNITYRPPKKKRFNVKKKVDCEEVKELLLKKVNQDEENTQPQDLVIEEKQEIENEEKEAFIEEEGKEEQNLEKTDNYVEDTERTVTVRKYQKPKKSLKERFKIGVVGIELVVIGILAATIFLTNALNQNSGINVFMRSVFGTQSSNPVDNKVYTDFTPTLPVDNFSALSVDGGVMTISGEESVYSPCDGTISSVVQGEDGKYLVEITHNDNFKTTFSGLDYVYCGEGDIVYSTLPVGYVDGADAKMCFYSEGDTLITDYVIEDETLVWKSLN